MSNLEYALNIMANLAAGLPIENLTKDELKALEKLIQLGKKAESILKERECFETFCPKRFTEE